MSFELDNRLARDACVIGDWPLARVLLMNDARWPWLILVPGIGASRGDALRRRRRPSADRGDAEKGCQFSPSRQARLHPCLDNMHCFDV